MGYRVKLKLHTHACKIWEVQKRVYFFFWEVVDYAKTSVEAYEKMYELIKLNRKRKTIQKNIIAGGDVCGGDIIKGEKP